MGIPTHRARRAILVDDGLPFDPTQYTEHINLFDEDGNRILFGGSAIGIPAGGTTGQILAKASSDDYDVEWIDPPV